jgi:hypothetical protein
VLLEVLLDDEEDELEEEPELSFEVEEELEELELEEDSLGRLNGTVSACIREPRKNIFKTTIKNLVDMLTPCSILRKVKLKKLIFIILLKKVESK